MNSIAFVIKLGLDAPLVKWRAENICIECLKTELMEIATTVFLDGEVWINHRPVRFWFWDRWRIAAAARRRFIECTTAEERK